MAEAVYVALGSNIGDRDAHLRAAIAAIGGIRDTSVTGSTAVEETEPIGPGPQGRYLNQMISVSTELEPRTLLAELHRIERQAGRVRETRWGPRTLDLDIVMIEGREYRDEVLTVPHPELPNRDFWVRHLQELRGKIDG